MKRTHYTVEAVPFGVHASIFTAFRIASKYSHRLPTPKELREDFGMCRATAYRWLRAMKDARAVA